MALSMSLTGIPYKQSDDYWFIDHLHWRMYTLSRDPRFRKVGLVCGYEDFVAALSVDEALALCFIERLRAGETESTREAEVHRLLLSHRRSTWFVLAHIYEWESGLD